MSHKRTCYELLEVKPGEAVEVIRLSYRRLAEIYHPDVPGTGSVEMFRQITDAWLTLCDKRRRHEYDESLGRLNFEPD